MDAMTDAARKATGATLPRFGAKTIGAVERGERQLYEHEAVELGRLFGVSPDSFFPSDGAGETQLDRIEAKLDWIIQALTSRGEEPPADPADYPPLPGPPPTTPTPQRDPGTRQSTGSPGRAP